MKKTELIYVLVSVAIFAILARIVLNNNPEINIKELALLKVFYMSLMNVSFAFFSVTFRGLRFDPLEKISRTALSLSVFFGAYVCALALVIGK